MHRFSFASSSGITVSVIAIVVNILLMASKMAAGILFGSAGLVADSVHSLTDIFGSVANQNPSQLTTQRFVAELVRFLKTDVINDY